MSKIFFPILFCCSFSISQINTISTCPYKIQWETDGWILGSSFIAGGLAYSIETNLSPLSLSELQSLDKSSINSFDRVTAGFYNSSQSSLSDVLVGVSIAAPLSLVLDNEIRKDYITLGVMYAETAALAAITPSLGKGLTKRIRPYAYGTAAPIEVRTESDAQRSFFSRHSTFAFAMAVSMSTVYDEYFPDSKYSSYVWIGSFGLATSVATLRVTSGSHFMTDVLVGAVVGSGIGYFIPYIHSKQSENISLVPSFSPLNRKILLTIYF